MEKLPTIGAENAHFDVINKTLLGKSLTPREAAALYKAAYEELRERVSELAPYKKALKDQRAILFCEYLDLIMGSFDPETYERLEPVSKVRALDILAKRHGIASAKPCYQHIEEYISERRKASAHIPPILPSSEKV
jgi:hypothetical protein